MNSENIYLALLLNFVTQFWWVVLLMIAVSVISMFSPIIKGMIGEGVVNLAAKLRLDPKVYHLIKDVTLPTKKGTTQIDHIIVSKFGIFVIETKNYKGWIFADAKSAKWTQVNYKQKHQFQNPLRQNYAHICALSELLDLPKEKILGVVCFMGDAKFKKGIPEGVFLEGSYVNHIQSFQTPIFSEAEVADLIQRIESDRMERGFKTNRAHVQNLRNREAPAPLSENNGPSQAQERSLAQVCQSIDQRICPKCGAEMVLRTAKRGANAGNQFWGCSNYPACRQIMPT
jgi:hypothetical protein